MEERGEDYGRIYGYSVCLLMVLVFLYAGVRMASGILDGRELLYTEDYRSGPSLVSPEVYRMDLLARTGAAGGGEAAASLFPADSTIRRMYSQERKYRLALTHQQSRTTVVVNLCLAVAAVLIFGTHAWWLSRRGPPASQ